MAGQTAGGTVQLWLPKVGLCEPKKPFLTGHVGHRGRGTRGWTSLITEEVGCGLGPPVDKHNRPVMEISGYDDKQVSNEELQNRNPTDSSTLHRRQ